MLVIAAVGQIKIVFFSAMISPGMHYDAGLYRPAGGGRCSPAFRAAGSTTIVFYRQHVLKSMLKWSHPRMLSCGVLRVHDSQPRPVDALIAHARDQITGAAAAHGFDSHVR